jgi:tRNA(fMet)-specific endonuclease VapC
MTRCMLDTNMVSHLIRNLPAVARCVVSVPMASLSISAHT